MDKRPARRHRLEEERSQLPGRDETHTLVQLPRSVSASGIKLSLSHLLTCLANRTDIHYT